jgi:hypothetical protein
MNGRVVVYGLALIGVHYLVSAVYLAVVDRTEDAYFGAWLVYRLPILIVAVVAVCRRLR